MSEVVVSALMEKLGELGPRDAAKLLKDQEDSVIAAALGGLHHALAVTILEALSEDRRAAIKAHAPSATRDQWTLSLKYAKGTIGRLMDQPRAVFPPDMTVGDAIERLREIVKQVFVTYAYVQDEQGRLLGVLVMRDLMLADREQTLDKVMLGDPFFLKPGLEQMDGMRAVLGRHYPVYPVCDDQGRLVGTLRGSTLFERQAFELTAQAGTMVGVEKEERLATPWKQSLKSRHPWLQLNLVTAFVAAGVVGYFEGTIAEVVVLAVFLPVLAGQSGNTGCQALAVALRAMTLGELKRGKEKIAVIKEAVLGLCNGVMVGVTAGLGMLIYATFKGEESAFRLSAIVFMAMVGSCVLSGIAGVLVPVTLKRLGADPATASSIFLTTATDVASMGLFLGLATVLI